MRDQQKKRLCNAALDTVSDDFRKGVKPHPEVLHEFLDTLKAIDSTVSVNGNRASVNALSARPGTTERVSVNQTSDWRAERPCDELVVHSACTDHNQEVCPWGHDQEKDRRGAGHGGVKETPRLNPPVPDQLCSTVTDAGDHYDQWDVREGCFPIHEKCSPASHGPDGLSSADDTDTSATLHQNQRVPCKDAHGVPSVIGNDTDGQLSEASTANSNSDTGTDSERRDHGQHDSNDEDASGVARPESDGMSIDNDLDLEDIPPLVESSDDSDTEANSAVEGGSNEDEGLSPLFASSKDSDPEAAEGADPSAPVPADQSATRTKRAAANLAKLSRCPVVFADKGMQRFKQLDNNAGLDDLAPGHSSVGHVA